MYEVPKIQAEKSFVRYIVRDLLIISTVSAVAFKLGIETGLLEWLIGDSLREAFEIPAPSNPIMKSIAESLNPI